MSRLYFYTNRNFDERGGEYTLLLLLLSASCDHKRRVSLG
jgi:hypothetical protein